VAYAPVSQTGKGEKGGVSVSNDRGNGEQNQFGRRSPQKTKSKTGERWKNGENQKKREVIIHKTTCAVWEVEIL